MFVCEKHRSFSIGDALKMQAKNECHVCEISTLRAQLSALREHLEIPWETFGSRIEWLNRAREILGGE